MTSTINTQSPSVALLVFSCDRYQFLYEGFEYSFSKNWDFTIPCKYYFSTEEADVTLPGFDTIKSGKGEWANRLAYILTEKVKEDYVLFFQEDMWLNKTVNASFFKKLFDLTLTNKWKLVKLHSSNVYKTLQTTEFIEGFNIAKVDNLNSDFLMSHQVSLWDRKFLISQLHKNEHPWRNERRGTKRLKQLNPEIFQVDYFAENGNEAINKNNNPIGRSEYQTISVNATLNHNVQPFIQQLELGDAQQLKYASKLRHNYDHNLTHDGKTKPRKEDFFQKIKRKIRAYKQRGN